MIKTWQDVLLEIVETDPADFTDRRNICISSEDLGNILRAVLAERDAEIERLKTVPMKYRRMTFNAELQNEIAAQRKVLEQALEALKYVGAGSYQQHAAAFTAIQEVLK
jgi:hypothetical protein